MDDRTLNKWMALELHTLNNALVKAPARLGDVAGGGAPTAPTRGGEPHRFDREAACRLGEKLSPLLARRLRVPITFYLDKDSPGSVYLTDGPAVDALRAVGRLAADREMREGKLWMGEPLARDFAREYPTLAQFVAF